MDSFSDIFVSLFNVVAQLLSFGLTGFFGILSTVISISFSIGIHIACTYPIYKLAKNAGISNAWLAFIPIANIYISLIIPKREFNIFNWYKTDDRQKVFWIYLIILGSVTVVEFFLGFLGIIPFVGFLISPLLYLLSFATFVLNGIFTWRVYYDILMTYGMEENAMVISILSVFIPLIFVVFAYISLNREPNYDI